ncbi:Eukaryotic initiation factor 4A-III, partial [Lobosporangium transversale]
MSRPTLAELSISLNHVQSLLKQITDEVKVLSDGIAVLVEQEEAEDLEEELNYLDVDPWSNVSDKDKNAAKAARQDSIRSLLQRKPSTVKDETKALARILSQKKSGTGSGTGTGVSNGKDSEKQQQQKQQSSLTPPSRPNSSLHDQAIEEDSTSSEGSLSYQRGRSGTPLPVEGDKQELESGSDLTAATLEAERVPHTITVQTTPTPTRFSIAITKPATPQSPSTPVLSTSTSHSSILSALNTYTSSTTTTTTTSTTTNNGTHNVPPPFWRSATAPNVNEGSRPNSVLGNPADGYSARGISVQNVPQRRSLQPEPRSASDLQIIGQGNGSVKDRYTQALRSNSQGVILHPSVGKDSLKSVFTINSPKPMVASQVERIESADCFSKLGLVPELLRGIYAYGLKMPSILQQRGIPMIMTRHDVLTQAKPEVAKTLTYAIPLLNFLTLPATSIHPQLLILCSNHDLCLHVQRVLLALARFMPTISCLICAEGTNATLSLGTMSTTQLNLAGHSTTSKNGFISRGSQPSDSPQVIAAHVVIGTPNKVLNLIKTKQISISALKVMVLENADILLAPPLKDATVSLLSMVRDPSANTNGGAATTGHGQDLLLSPPNSGPTSPVSAAVAALNGRSPGGGGSGSSPGSVRFSGSFGDSDSRPRSLPGASGSSYNSGSSSSLRSSPSPPPPTPAINQPQLLFFSTDVPSHVLDYVAQYMTQPTKALVKGHELALKGILQYFKYMTVDNEEWQLSLLFDLLEDSGANRAVVFCNSDESIERVIRKIREHKGFAIGIYSDMDMTARKAAISRFRGSAPPCYLIMSDESSKDLETVGVPLVVSFEMPSVGNYIPRVKWIDRAKGKVGAKVTLVDGHKGEGQALRAIQQQYRTTIDDLP